jgi:SAM-dependent methyltransferase
MLDQSIVARHYTQGNLLVAIREVLAAHGGTPDDITVDDLAAIDEFHTGGRGATGELVARLDLTPDPHVLDVGCGLGGTARFIADRFSCRVTGIDLTAESVETGQELTRRRCSRRSAGSCGRARCLGSTTS